MDFDFSNFVIGSNILPKFLTLWRNSFPRSAQETKTERGCGDAGSWEATLEAGALASMSILALRCPELINDELTKTTMGNLKS
uniref:Uncharacterized protein n=1 Tax=Meloidogyne enterolobii TaxID=390850 RepID=A0A6V7UCI3_MELEN|nr:unnamed protein product [Meloidogyne enterolobii]